MGEIDHFTLERGPECVSGLVFNTSSPMHIASQTILHITRMITYCLRLIIGVFFTQYLNMGNRGRASQIHAGHAKLLKRQRIHVN